MLETLGMPRQTGACVKTETSKVEEMTAKQTEQCLVKKKGEEAAHRDIANDGVRELAIYCNGRMRHFPLCIPRKVVEEEEFLSCP